MKRGAVADLISEGKVRYLGVSEVNADQLRQFIPLSPCDPRVVSVRFDVIHGSPIAQHSLTDFDNGLLREARGYQPEISPMVSEECARYGSRPLVTRRACAASLNLGIS